MSDDERTDATPEQEAGAGEGRPDGDHSPLASDPDPISPDRDEGSLDPDEVSPDAGEVSPDADEVSPHAGEVSPGPGKLSAAAAEVAPPAAESESEPAGAESEPARDAGAPPQGSEGRPTREKKEDVVPGADLVPDLVLREESTRRPADEFGEGYMADDYAGELGADAEPEVEELATDEEPAPVALTPVDLAAEARYRATGKRKTAVARVILKPGKGEYRINGRTLEEFFPRPTLQKVARRALETAGYEDRIDVIARVHGGGVSAQAGAVRHGVARALIEADPNLRGELKRRGFLTRDARVKERKKAGLKKARKRPQFSKR